MYNSEETFLLCNFDSENKPSLKTISNKKLDGILKRTNTTIQISLLLLFSNIGITLLENTQHIHVNV